MSGLRRRVKSCFDFNRTPTSADFLNTGICHFVSDKDLAISVEVPADDAVIYFFASLLPLTNGSIEHLLEKASILNASVEKIRGASVGMHSELNAFGLYYALDVSVDKSSNKILSSFNNFIANATSIAKKLNVLMPANDANIVDYPSVAERRVNWG